MQTKAIQVGGEYAVKDSASKTYYRSYRVRVLGPLQDSPRKRGWGGERRKGFRVEVVSMWDSLTGTEAPAIEDHVPFNWDRTEDFILVNSRYFVGPWEEEVKVLRSQYEGRVASREYQKQQDAAYLALLQRWNACGGIGFPDSARRTVSLTMKDLETMCDILEGRTAV